MLTLYSHAQSIAKQVDLPAAVPVVNAEEAEKLNEEAKEFALAEKERREPFFRLYQDSNIETFCFEGTIRATSTIPDPTKNDYDNCLYALFIELDSLLSDIPGETKIPCEVIVNTPIMKGKTILQDNKFLPGDKVWCTCAEYDAMPQDIQEIQLSDDIQSYEHQQYYSMTIHKITAFQKGGNRNFAKREITVLPLQILPKEEKAVIARKKRIQSEIQRIEEELKKHGGSFESWKEEYKPIAKKYKDFCKNDYKVWIGNSFFAANGSETSYATKAYINSLLPYKKYLEKNNIDLIILRIPSKGDFAARVLTPTEGFQENPSWVEHYYECLKNDIEIVDPMPLMWEHRFDFPLFYYYNDPEEIHPFEGAQFISSIAISDVLKRYEYEKEPQDISLLCVSHNVNKPKFFYPEGNENYPSSEHVRFNQVVFNGSPLINLNQNSGSPFLFLGNCFFGRFIIKELSIPLYVAYQMQTLPDFMYREGVRKGLIRHLFASQEILTRRKAVIMIGMPDIWKAYSTFPRYLLEENVKITLEETITFDSDRILIQDKTGSFQKQDGGYVIEPETCKRISFFLTIPSIPDKNNCMLRFKWLKTGLVPSVNIYNAADNSIIEYGSQPEKKKANAFCDFFIPMTGQDEVIKMELSQDNSNILDNIELWYY